MSEEVSAETGQESVEETTTDVDVKSETNVSQEKDASTPGEAETTESTASPKEAQYGDAKKKKEKKRKDKKQKTETGQEEDAKKKKAKKWKVKERKTETAQEEDDRKGKPLVILTAVDSQQSGSRPFESEFIGELFKDVAIASKEDKGGYYIIEFVDEEDKQKALKKNKTDFKGKVVLVGDYEFEDENPPPTRFRGEGPYHGPSHRQPQKLAFGGGFHPPEGDRNPRRWASEGPEGRQQSRATPSPRPSPPAPSLAFGGKFNQ